MKCYLGVEEDQGFRTFLLVREGRCPILDQEQSIPAYWSRTRRLQLQHRHHLLQGQSQA